MNSVSILGIPVHAVTFLQTLQAVESYVADGRPHQIVTANALMILAAQKNPDLARAFREAALVVPDSFGVVFAAQWKRFPLNEQVPGIELMDRMCRHAGENGWRVFFLGAAPGVAARAAEALAARHPGLTVCGTEHGHFPLNMEEHVAAKVANAAPDILFVALDMPRQDIWIHRNLQRLGCKVAMGVGGSFDVISGKLKRAPRWMQSLGLEWLFRLVQEPRRVRRMLGLPIFMWKVLREKN